MVLITRAEEIPGERWSEYAERVVEAGGEPRALDVESFTSLAVVPAHDALIVTGGVDVDPARYGEPPHPRLGATSALRDEVEGALLRAAVDAGRPLLPICRGAQLFNVVMGGTLLQHLEQREPHRSRRGPDGVTPVSGWHEVAVTPGTLLARLAGAPVLRTNSRHHQAVTPERLAPGLVAAGVTTAGEVTVVEALELPGHPFALAVQWHPEREEMASEPALAGGSRALFAALVDAARRA